jgi:outer membrane protein assembly factor BamB
VRESPAAGFRWAGVNCGGIGLRRLLFVPLILGFLVYAQGADWLTDGGNPQRTAWQKDEKILTAKNVKDMKLLWKIHLDNKPHVMTSLFPPLIVGAVSTPTGVKQIAIEAGASDNIYAIDVERGELLWKKHFIPVVDAATFGRGGNDDINCPGGITATPVISPTDISGKYTAYVVSWDGMLHQLNVATGEDVAPPSPFVPPNGKAYALNLWNNVLYTHTGNRCGGIPDIAFSYDLGTRKVGAWGPSGGGMWGRTGPAISADGTMFTGTGDGRFDPETGAYGSAIVGLKQNPDTKALELADYYGPTNAEWLYKRDLDLAVTPAIFNYKGRELMVTGGKECRLYLLDAQSIGGDDHRTPLYRSPLICNEDVNFASAGIWGSLASWQDPKGVQWVLSPIWGPTYPGFKFPIEHGAIKYGAVAAFRVEESEGKWQLAPVWISRDMNRAEPPVIANGVVFAYGSGEDTDQAAREGGLTNTPETRIPGSTHAVMYALDAYTGKELWSSGDQITSWGHFTGLSLANGRVYFGTYDSTLYCFGIKK